MVTTLPFDRVRLSTPEGPAVLTVEAFLGLPLHQRIQRVLQREVQFFSGERMVPQAEALKALQGMERERLAGQASSASTKR